MIIIAETDLGCVCENGKCTSQAVYAITLNLENVVVRLYCPACTRELVEGVAKVLEQYPTQKISDYLDFEKFMTGDVIDV